MEHDPLDLTGQAAIKEATDNQLRLDAEDEGSDIKWLMGSRRGRRIVWRLLEQTGVFRSTFSPTAMVMAFQEGNRNFGNRTLELIHGNCPELYPTMMKEQVNGKSDDRAKQ